MKKTILILFGLVFLAGCTLSQQDGTTQIANPASVYCVDQGGTLDMRESSLGTYGVCIFSDGSECEEWEYFREECAMGDSLSYIGVGGDLTQDLDDDLNIMNSSDDLFDEDFDLDLDFG